MSSDPRIPALAEHFASLSDIIAKRQATTALLIRGCVARLKSPDSRRRAEAIRALEDLADLIEGKNANIGVIEI